MSTSMYFRVTLTTRRMKIMILARFNVNLYVFQSDTDDSSDEDYDPSEELKRRKLDKSKATTVKAGGGNIRMIVDAGRPYSNGKSMKSSIAGRVGTTSKKTKIVNTTVLHARISMSSEHGNIKALCACVIYMISILST